MALELLKQVAHFRRLSDPALRRLAAAFHRREVSMGETLYRPGDPVDELFVVGRGTVMLFRQGAEGEALPDARLRRGDVFGVIDLFDNELRTESARAAEDGVVFGAARGELLRLLEHEPLAALNLRLAAARGHAGRSRAALAVAQRRAVRRRVNQEVRLMPELGPACQATAVDISELGICLDGVPAVWQQGGVVRFGLAWRDHRLGLAGRIVWRKGHEVGIEFDSPTPMQRAATLELVDRMLRNPLT